MDNYQEKILVEDILKIGNKIGRKGKLMLAPVVILDLAEVSSKLNQKSRK